MGCYSGIKKDEILPFATKGLDLEGGMCGPKENKARRQKAGWFAASRGWRRQGRAETAGGEGTSFGRMTTVWE